MRSCGRHGRIALGIALVALASGTAAAQSSARTRGPTPVPKRRPLPDTTGRGPSADLPVVLETTRAPAVVVPEASAAPSVVTIAVPSSLPAAAQVHFTVTPFIDGAVIGTLTGTLPPAAPGAARSILFAARTPRLLPAGRTDLAMVRFSTRVSAVEIPLVAQVAQSRDIRITPASALGATSAGAPLTIAYRLSNLGNAPDTVAVQVIPPAGWRVVESASDRAIAIPMRGTVDRRAQVVSPTDARGIAPIRVLVLAAGAPVAEARIDVEVVGGTVAQGPAGPTMRLGAAVASGPWGDIAQVRTVEVDGALSDDMYIWGRASTSALGQGIASYAFSRADILTAPPTLQLSTPSLKVGAGVIGTTMSDLTGVNIVGRGATLAVQQPGWNLRLVGASPDLGAGEADGSLFGGRIEATPGRFSVSGAVTRLRETRIVSRDLDAISVGAGAADVLGGRWAAEAARRRFGGTDATGWSAAYSRRTADDNVDVRYVRAPGGSRAFARNASEVSASASRRLVPGVSLIASAWRSSDEGLESLAGLTMDGWSLGAHVALGRAADASLTARRSDFGATTVIGGFGSGERALEAALSGRVGEVVTRLSATGALLRRETTLAGDANERFIQEAPRVGVRAEIGVGGQAGSIGLTGQYDRSGEGIGYAPVQWSWGVEVSDAVVPGVGDWLRLNAGLERLGGFTTGADQLTVRAGATLALPRETTLSISAERNPWIVPGTGSAWMMVAGVTHAVHLPRLSTSETRGLVYRDLNGNGRRDGGEPGMQGVVLRRGADVAMTDDRGRYSLSGEVSQSFELDVRSLPIGWLAPTTTIPPGTREIGILAVSPLVVELRLEAGTDTTRANAAELGALALIARDAVGREWLARRPSSTTAVFDALPPGRYTIAVDATASREPLRPVGDIPVVTVTAGRAISPLAIELRARALRFAPPNPGRP